EQSSTCLVFPRASAARCRSAGIVHASHNREGPYMQTEKPNGYPAAHPVRAELFAKGAPPIQGPQSNVKLVTSASELPTPRSRPIAGNRKITLEDVTKSGLLGSIRQDGQQVPGLCAKDEDREGCWIIIAGNSRWLCCDVLGIEFRFLPVEGDTSP